jgi:hypothetical protein
LKKHLFGIIEKRCFWSLLGIPSLIPYAGIRVKPGSNASLLSIPLKGGKKGCKKGVF